ncbi:hypothetical protein BsWGS_08547 [Bradybaena similaris]
MKEATSNFKAVATESKQHACLTFAQEVSSEKPLLKFWKLHRHKTNRPRAWVTKDIADTDGAPLTSDSQKGAAFFERYINQADQGNADARTEVRDELTNSLAQHVFVPHVTSEDVTRAIKSANDGAPGPDGVRYRHLTNLEVETIAKIADEYNESTRTGTIPEMWLHSYLQPLPKQSGDGSRLDGYRIITLQNVYGKLVEKIIARRLSNSLETAGLLPDTLGGYRPGRDTAVNVAVLAFEVYEGFQRKEETALVALDLEDAYNRVDYSVLIQVLKNWNIDLWLVRWIASLLLERTVALRFGQWTSETRRIAPGLRQGSPLSPVLFNAYTAMICRQQANGPGHTLTYADDILTYVHGKCRQQITNQLQANVNCILTWCDDHNAAINPAKAKVLWCSLNNRICNSQLPEITCNDTPIERVHCMRYLGISLDRSLSFKHHVERVIEKARRGINAVKVMAGAGFQQRTLFLLMLALVISPLEYGLGLLTLSPTQITKLERIQNEAMRAVLGCTRDTPVATMRYMLALTSMKTRHAHAQVKAMLNVASKTNHPLAAHCILKKEIALSAGSPGWQGQRKRYRRCARCLTYPLETNG